MICKKCGFEVKSDFKFCPHCGERMVSGFQEEDTSLTPPFVIDVTARPVENIPEAEFEVVDPFEEEAENPAQEQPYFVYRPQQTTQPRQDWREDSWQPVQEPVREEPNPQKNLERKRPNIFLKLLVFILALALAGGVSLVGYDLLQKRMSQQQAPLESSVDAMFA